MNDIVTALLRVRHRYESLLGNLDLCKAFLIVCIIPANMESNLVTAT